MKVDQRQALATLNKAELREIAESFELAAPATLLKDELIELLARSRRASFEKILENLKREALKAICRAAGLDDSGREKAVIVDRILGRDAITWPVGPAEETVATLREAPAKAPPAEPAGARGPASPARGRSETTAEEKNGATLGPEWADSFHRNLHRDLRADYLLANPPFNSSDWGGQRLREDVRWKYGVPPPGNANFAWVEHFIRLPAGLDVIPGSGISSVILGT